MVSRTGKKKKKRDPVVHKYSNDRDRVFVSTAIVEFMLWANVLFSKQIYDYRKYIPQHTTPIIAFYDT